MVLAVFPVIHANTKMLVGSQLFFVRTQKEGGVSLHSQTEGHSASQ
jgi:hypothetical protein